MYVNISDFNEVKPVNLKVKRNYFPQTSTAEDVASQGLMYTQAFNKVNLLFHILVFQKLFIF